jgi:hypothetical protein
LKNIPFGKKQSMFKGIDEDGVIAAEISSTRIKPYFALGQ